MTGTKYPIDRPAYTQTIVAALARHPHLRDVFPIGACIADSVVAAV